MALPWEEKGPETRLPTPGTYTPLPTGELPADAAPTGRPVMPNSDDYWVKLDTYGDETPAMPSEPGAWLNVYSYNKDLDDYNKMVEGDTGGSAASAAAAMAGVQAQNMGNYLSGVISGVEAELAAGRLTLDQAQGEFDRRLDALQEAGNQMSDMWQWTVPKDAGTLHPDIRGDLGMEPWKSQPVAWDPFGRAMEIVGETPELTGPPVPTDPIQEALKLAQGLI